MNTDGTSVVLEYLDLSPFGISPVELLFTNGSLVRIRLGPLTDSVPEGATATFAMHLRRLVAGMELEKFPVPFKLEGSPFQMRIWRAAMAIGHGRTVTYGELAKAAGCGSPRAVGQALGRNPLPIIVPCHRVVGKGGRLTGFSAGIELKRALLGFERMQFHEDSSNE